MILVIRMKVILIRIFNYLIVPIAETDRICCVLESSECLFIKFVSKSIFFTIQPDFIQVFRIQVEKKEFILLSSPKIELVMSSNKSHIIACGKLNTSISCCCAALVQYAHLYALKFRVEFQNQLCKGWGDQTFAQYAIL